jgi:dihydromethanopterin reductase
MVDVRVICAIGKHGQLGLNGRLPWEGNPGTEYKADVQRFFALTRGHVVIAGPRTIASFPDWARSERTLVEIHAADEPDAILKRYCDRVVYVGGGPPVWKAYAHLIRHWDVTRLPYDGDADRYFDPNWLFAG